MGLNALIRWPLKGFIISLGSTIAGYVVSRATEYFGWVTSDPILQLVLSGVTLFASYFAAGVMCEALADAWKDKKAVIYEAAERMRFVKRRDS